MKRKKPKVEQATSQIVTPPSNSETKLLTVRPTVIVNLAVKGKVVMTQVFSRVPVVGELIVLNPNTPQMSQHIVSRVFHMAMTANGVDAECHIVDAA
jgi:hypothetical protein